MFWNKEKKIEKEVLESAEYRKLSVRITQLEADILGLATAQDVIRNKVLKKIRIKEQDSEDLEEKSDVWAGIPVV